MKTTTQALTEALRECGYYVNADDSFVQRIIAAGVKDGPRGWRNAMAGLDMFPANIERVISTFERIHREAFNAWSAND